MKPTRRLLLLAGSAEARVIAQSAQDQGWDVTAWISESPRGPNPMPVRSALKRFEDPKALAPQIAGFDAVIDASHGFDAQMTLAGFEAAKAQNLPFLRYARPLWHLEKDWQAAADIPSAMPLIWPKARAFSATGWASLSGYATFPGAVLMLRQTSSSDQPLPFGFVQRVVGTPPFTTAGETALFRRLQVDTLICRNLGGTPSRPKLEAALALNLQVILVAPPERPKGIETRNTIGEVTAWLGAQ